MTITVLSDVIMPNTLIQAGLSGRNIRNNTRSFNQAGYGQINVNWSLPLREFDLGYIPSLPEVWQTIEGLWEITAAGAYGFLMEDPKDCTVSATQGALQPYRSGNVGTIGLGFGEPVYRLFKRYPAYGSASINDRYITRPQPTPVLLRGGVPVTYGGSAGNASLVDGTVTFVADQVALVTGVTVGTTTQISLIANLGILAGGRLWLDSMTGANAGLLNNRSHEVLSVGGGGLDYVLNTNTSGAVIDASGNGKKYPQPTESLAWTGRFYVPVHFVSDELPWELIRSGPADTRLISGQGIVLREVRE